MQGLTEPRSAVLRLDEASSAHVNRAVARARLPEVEALVRRVFRRVAARALVEEAEEFLRGLPREPLPEGVVAPLLAGIVAPSRPRVVAAVQAVVETRGAAA